MNDASHREIDFYSYDGTVSFGLSNRNSSFSSISTVRGRFLVRPRETLRGQVLRRPWAYEEEEQLMFSLVLEYPPYSVKFPDEVIFSSEIRSLVQVRMAANVLNFPELVVSKSNPAIKLSVLFLIFEYCLNSFYFEVPTSPNCDSTISTSAALRPFRLSVSNSFWTTSSSILLFFLASSPALLVCDLHLLKYSP